MRGFRKSAFSVTQGRVVPVYGMKEFHHVHDGEFARKLNMLERHYVYVK
jgi:hypothetical protein